MNAISPSSVLKKIRRRKAEIVVEPMFSRYLFVRLDLSGKGKSYVARHQPEISGHLGMVVNTVKMEEA